MEQPSKNFKDIFFLSIWECFKIFLMYVWKWYEIFFVFSWFFIFQIIWCSCELFKSFNKIKSSTYTIIIVNLIFVFLVKLHRVMKLFTNPYSNSYFLRWLFAWCILNPIGDYLLRMFFQLSKDLIASCILNPSRILTCLWIHRNIE